MKVLEIKHKMNKEQIWMSEKGDEQGIVQEIEISP